MILAEQLMIYAKQTNEKVSSWIRYSHISNVSSGPEKVDVVNMCDVGQSLYNAAVSEFLGGNHRFYLAPGSEARVTDVVKKFFRLPLTEGSTVDERVDAGRIHPIFMACSHMYRGESARAYMAVGLNGASNLSPFVALVWQPSWPCASCPPCGTRR